MNRKPFVTIIYCFRERELERVKRSIDSLNQQDDSDFEVIFVDYGSTSRVAQVTNELVLSYTGLDIKYIYNNTQGMPWNRAHALNTGIRFAKADFVFTADIDLIFKRKFISTLKGLNSVNKAIFFPVFLLPKKFTSWALLENYENFERTGNQGLGISIIPIGIIKKINGYDEFYSFWGYEDNDLFQRIRNIGVETEFHDEEVLMYHQWHPNFFDNHTRFPKGWRMFMENYFKAMLNKEIVRNRNNWGVLFNSSERPALLILNDPSSHFEDLYGEELYINFFLSQSIKKLGNGKSLSVQFKAEKYMIYKSSFATKFIDFVNSYLKRNENIPFILLSKYKEKNLSVYDVRDILVNFINLNKEHIHDYAIQLGSSGNTIKFVLI